MKVTSRLIKFLCVRELWRSLKWVVSWCVWLGITLQTAYRPRPLDVGLDAANHSMCVRAHSISSPFSKSSFTSLNFAPPCQVSVSTIWIPQCRVSMPTANTRALWHQNLFWSENCSIEHCRFKSNKASPTGEVKCCKTLSQRSFKKHMVGNVWMFRKTCIHKSIWDANCSTSFKTFAQNCSI